MTHTMTQPTCVTNEDESHEMMAVWPDVVRDITDAFKSLDPDITKWITKVLQHNVLAEKNLLSLPLERKERIRSLSLIYAYKLLAPNNELTEENIRLIQILAWCIQLIQGQFIVIDDILDRSLFRWNQPCWYRYNDIGLAAINDALLLEACAFHLIRKHFKGKEYYVEIVETFQDISMKTTIGQSLDLLSTNFGKKPNLDLFTMDRYNSICKYKTSYTFILQIFTAMHCAGIKDPEMFRQAKTILLEMGHFYQVQDDYLGCYGNTEVVGKDSTDIEEGKCTWLVVVALQRVTPMQRKILEECYGFSDPEKVSRVKHLYNDLGLPNTYSIYEEETYNLLNTHIQQISRGVPQSIFLNLLGKFYRRVS